MALILQRMSSLCPEHRKTVFIHSDRMVYISLSPLSGQFV